MAIDGGVIKMVREKGLGRALGGLLQMAWHLDICLCACDTVYPPGGNGRWWCWQISTDHSISNR